MTTVTWSYQLTRSPTSLMNKRLNTIYCILYILTTINIIWEIWKIEDTGPRRGDPKIFSLSQNFIFFQNSLFYNSKIPIFVSNLTWIIISRSFILIRKWEFTDSYYWQWQFHFTDTDIFILLTANFFFFSITDTDISNLDVKYITK